VLNIWFSNQVVITNIYPLLIYVINYNQLQQKELILILISKSYMISIECWVYNKSKSSYLIQ